MTPAHTAVRIEACDVASCGKPLIWARTVKGNVMPVDAVPDPGGNVLLDTTRTDRGGRPYAGVLGPAQARGVRAAGRELRTHHRLTCTDPAQWSRAAARAGAPA